MKPQFLDMRQGTEQMRMISEKRETNKVSPTVTPAYCLW